MKKILTAATITIAILALAACGSDSEVVVKTDAGNITKEEFYNELKTRNGENTLQEMITTKVLEGKYEVDEKEIDEQIDTMKEQIGDQFDFWLMQQGIADEDAFRDILRTGLLYEEAIYSDVEISDEEVDERYERMKTEVEAQHILVEDEDIAKEVKKKLDDGGDFGKLAKEYSTDEGSADNEGKLDYFSVGLMVPEFEDAAYTLDIDTISDPVESDHGYHIVKVLDRRDIEEDIGSLEDNEEAIRSEIKQTKVDETEAQEKLEKLIEDAKVDIKIKEFEDILDTEALDDGEIQG